MARDLGNELEVRTSDIFYTTRDLKPKAIDKYLIKTTYQICVAARLDT